MVVGSFDCRIKFYAIKFSFGHEHKLSQQDEYHLTLPGGQDLGFRGLFSPKGLSFETSQVYQLL